MAFNVSNESFEEAFGKRNKRSVTDQFLDELEDYLEKEEGRTPERMLSWLKKGGKLSTFTCREDVLYPMIGQLREEDIPYVVVRESNGNTGILIRSRDVENTKKLIKKTLGICSAVCTVTSGEDTERYYLHSKEEDKMMIQIGGLSEGEAMYLENLCNSALNGEMIGIDIMPDGTRLFTCHGKTAMAGKREKAFRSAVAETMSVMNGESSEKMKEYERKVAVYRKERAAGFPDADGGMEKPVWVVGDGERFVKRTAGGFDLGHAVEIDDNVLLETDMSVDISDRRYEARLNSALSKITGHTCLYDIRDVIAWFKTKRNYWQDKAVTGQKLLVAHADKIAAKKIRKDSIMRMEGKWDQKLSHYQHEMSKLITAAVDGKIPDGYKKEDIRDLRNVIGLFSLDTSALRGAMNRAAAIETYEKEAGPKKVQNVQKHIDKYSGRSSTQERDTTRSRTDSRGGDRS